MNTESLDIVRPQLSATRIIVLALSAGVLVFIGFVLVQRMGGVAPQAKAANVEFVGYIGYAYLAAMLGLLPVILGAVDSATRKRIGPSASIVQWANAFQQRTIVGCALIESATFMCVIAAMMDGQPWGLIASAVGAAAMLGIFFPTPARFEAYLERQRNRLA